MDVRLRATTRNANWVIAVIAVEVILLASIIHVQGFFRPLGMDFLATYTAADMVAHGDRTALYDTRAQWDYQRPITTRYDVRWPDRVMHPYTSPPLLAALGVPFLLLSPAAAALAWSTLNVVAAVAGVQLLARRLALDAQLVAALVLGAFPLAYIALLGQIEGLLFLALVLFMVELRAGRDVRAGLALSALMLKPPLLPAAFVYLLVTGKHRALLTTLAAATAQIALSMALVGRSGIADYVAFSRRLAAPAGSNVVNVPGMVNLRAIVVRALPLEPGLATTVSIAALSVATLLAAAWFWRRAGADAAGPAGLALLATTMTLTSYHALYHTTILGTLALALLACRARESGDDATASKLIGLHWLCFSFGPLALFLFALNSRMPAPLTTAGILLVWGVAAYTLAQAAPALAKDPLPRAVPVESGRGMRAGQ